MIGKKLFIAFCFFGICVVTTILVVLHLLKLTSLSPWLPMAIFVALLIPVFIAWIGMTVFFSTKVSQYGNN